MVLKFDEPKSDVGLPGRIVAPEGLNVPFVALVISVGNALQAQLALMLQDPIPFATPPAAPKLASLLPSLTPPRRISSEL